MNEALVSVIIPVYNVEQYLRRCIDSVLAQEYDNIEIILVDDGSTDNSPLICDEYNKNYANVKAFHKENGGLSSARNYGIENAKGEYITFLDSDDYIHPSFVDRLVQLLQEYNTKVSQCVFELGSENHFASFTEEIQVTRHEGSTTFGNRAVKIAACGKMYEASLFETLRFPIGKINEDEFTTYKAIDASGSIVTTNERLYYYYENPDSIMRKERQLVPLDAFEAYEERLAYFKEKGDLVAYELSRKEYLLRILIIYSRCTKRRDNLNDKGAILSLYRENYAKLRRDLISKKESLLLTVFRYMPKLCAFLLVKSGRV